MLLNTVLAVAGWAAAGGVVLALLGLPRWLAGRRFARAVYTLVAVPPQPAAIVFGAGLRRDGTPTTVLADRVEAAAQLFHAGKAQRVLMSGASQTSRGNEPLAMRNLAVRLGVPPEAIQLDPQGQRTFATCERALRLFHVRSAILVSQRYHLPRALATCHALGIRAVGAVADLHPYGVWDLSCWRLRELPATWVAWIETWLHRGRASHPGGERPSEVRHGS